MHGRKLHSIPGLYPLDAPSDEDNQKCLHALPNAGGGEHNHSQLRLEKTSLRSLFNGQPISCVSPSLMRRKASLEIIKYHLKGFGLGLPNLAN